MDESNSLGYVIETPISLIPDLSALGLEEIDRGVVEDTPDNRKIIRDAKLRYQPVITSEGEITRLIQVFSAESRGIALSAQKKYLLTDSRNPDSDYITGERLLFDPSAQEAVPAWVTATTREWLRVKAERETNPRYRPHLNGPPTRCSALRVDGHRCAMWSNGSATYGDFCRLHQANRAGGEDSNRPHTMAQARNRLESATHRAVDKLEQLLDATSEAVALGAARDLLDRAGIRGGVEVSSTVKVEVSAADIVKQRLKRLEQGAKEKQKIEELVANATTDDDRELDIVEAEIVDND